MSTHVLDAEVLGIPEKPPQGFRETLKCVQRRIVSFMTWENMLAYVALYGRSPFSKEQYALLRAALRAKSSDDDPVMKYYRTTRSQISS